MEQGESQRGKQLPAQIQSQTQIEHPDDNASQQHASVSPKTSAPVSLVAPSSSISATQNSASSLEDVPASISTSSGLTPPTIFPIVAASSLIPSNVPQKRAALPSETQTIQASDPAAVAHQQDSNLLDFQPTQSVVTAREGEPALDGPPSQIVSATPCPVTNDHILPPSSIPLPSEATPPAAKRRRVEFAHADEDSVHVSAHNDGGVPMQSETIEGHSTDLEDSTGVDSCPPQPEINQQLSKTRKPRLSGKAKGKQPMPQASVRTSTDEAGDSPNGLSRKRNVRNAADTRRQTTAEDAATNVVAHAVQGSSAKKGTRRRRKAREATPEGADTVKIMPSKVKMSELCKNTRTGKKSTRGKEIENLDKAEAVRKSQGELRGFLGATATSEDPPETAESRLERFSRAGQESAQMIPNTIIVDGEIQIDETSLQIDRHANAAAEREAEALEGIDESELTRRITSHSWLKRDTGGRWSAESTERFFEALQMFGTDFDMISKLFPGRSRHSIKLKFTKEEKADQQRIKQILMGERVLVDMDEYSRLTNTVYEDPKELENDLAEDRKRMEEEQRIAKEAIDEAARQRELEVEAERAAGEEEESLQRRKGRRRRGETKGSPKMGRAKKKKMNEVTTTEKT